MKEITILVSVKNKEGTIEKCVNSLIETDWPVKSIIVIDNLSTDKTPEILKKFGDKIKVYRRSGGISEVFNWGLSQVKTEYVAITDADCVVDENWLKELVKSFSEEKGIVAVVGYCGTPAGASFLQKIIGLELESRFKKFPKYINRGPTMNLCLSVKPARKIKFDENFVYQAFEADFGYRLQEYGKILYNPKAVIWHYHRSTLKDYFTQQKNQAKWGMKLLEKHGLKALADEITTPTMSIQIPLLLGAVLFLFLSIISFLYLIPAAIFFFALIGVYIKNILEIKPPPYCCPAFLGLFLFRNVAWLVGIVEGFLLIRPGKQGNTDKNGGYSQNTR